MIQRTGAREISGMAGVTVGRRATIVAVRVARPTINRRAKTGERESGGGVVKCRRRPSGRRMAGRAGVADVIGNVVERSGSHEIGLVAGITIGRSAAGESSRGMAGNTGRRSMQTGQRETGGRVIESGGLPDTGRMARRAGVTDTGGDVVRALGAGKVHRVASVAVGWCPAVVSGSMAGGTSDGGMCAGQRKGGRRMVEVSRAPTGGVVALGAVMAEILSGMIGISGAVVLSLVTGPAIGRRITAISIGMTLSTGHSSMRTCQGEGRGGMVETGRIPRCGGMTGRARVTDVI